MLSYLVLFAMKMTGASPKSAETRTRITRINSSRYEKERCCRELVYLVFTL